MNLNWVSKLTHLGITKKIWLNGAVGIVFILLSGLLIRHQTATSVRSLEDMRAMMKVADEAAQTSALIRSLSDPARAVAVTWNVNESRQQLGQRVEIYDAQFTKLQQLLSGEEAAELRNHLTQIDVGAKEIVQSANKVLTVAKEKVDADNANKPAVAQAATERVLAELANINQLDTRSAEALRALETLLRTQTAQHLNEDVEGNKASSVWSLLLLVISLVVTGVASYLIGRSVILPLKRLQKAAQDIASGNLDSVFDSSGDDELADLTREFERMTNYLREMSAAASAIARGDLGIRIGVQSENDALGSAFSSMVTSLQEIVKQIRDSSALVAAAAAEIFAASQEQEAAAQTQSSGMEEVSRTMLSLLESAGHITHSAQGVLTNAERTRETSDTTARKIGELNGQTSRMEEILELIREVADRSDLLALNAALEGTRAGDSGRGFSLVAAEMRRLAERVTKSVQDVKVLVADIRNYGAATVMSTEEGRKLAESTTESARQITFVTQQQRSGTEQVSQSMKDISGVLVQSLSAARETRSSAEELKTQAEKLTHVVNRFRVQRAE